MRSKYKKPCYKELCESVHAKLNSIRSVDHLVSTEAFRDVWDVSSPDSCEQAQEMIEKANRDSLFNWMQQHESIDFGEMSWAALVQLAREAKVKNYSRMDRVSLICALEEQRCQWYWTDWPSLKRWQQHKQW